ncbi:hypothetical protein F4803DRAFT_200249 [Xylaria telfairii]|nr:hypothetical protein F4803DRAFT_200249 [Xylaria telfairii]
MTQPRVGSTNLSGIVKANHEMVLSLCCVVQSNDPCVTLTWPSFSRLLQALAQWYAGPSRYRLPLTHIIARIISMITASHYCEISLKTGGNIDRHSRGTAHQISHIDRLFMRRGKMCDRSCMRSGQAATHPGAAIMVKSRNTLGRVSLLTACTCTMLASLSISLSLARPKGKGVLATQISGSGAFVDVSLVNYHSQDPDYYALQLVAESVLEHVNGQAKGNARASTMDSPGLGAGVATPLRSGSFPFSYSLPRR